MHVLLRRLSAAHDPAVLLVTHDVDEAVELADRVVVLERGKIVADLAVDLPDEGLARTRSFAGGCSPCWALTPRWPTTTPRRLRPPPRHPEFQETETMTQPHRQLRLG